MTDKEWKGLQQCMVKFVVKLAASAEGIAWLSAGGLQVKVLSRASHEKRPSLDLGLWATCLQVRGMVMSGGSTVLGAGKDDQMTATLQTMVPWNNNRAGVAVPRFSRCLD